MAEIGGYCTNCGTGWQAGQSYCGGCGTALGTAGPVGTASTAGPASTTGLPGATTDAPYPREAMIGAVLLTIFMPFIALIAALALRAQEMRPMRREQLKNWAIASGAWLATKL